MRTMAALLALGMVQAGSMGAELATIQVEVDKPGHAVSPLLFGIFFEDINLSADGGIYPERVRNRSFEDADKPEHWSATGHADIAIDSAQPLSPASPRSLQVTAQDAGGGVLNVGYWGMALQKGERYGLNLWARGTGALSAGWRTPTAACSTPAGRSVA